MQSKTWIHFFCCLMAVCPASQAVETRQENNPSRSARRSGSSWLRVNELPGCEVMNVQSQTLGEISEIYLTLPAGEQVVLLLKTKEEKFVPVPLGAFLPSAEPRRLILNYDAKDLQSRESFPAERLEDWSSLEMRRAIFRFFGQKYRLATGEPLPPFRTARTLFTSSLEDPQGEILGQFRDLILDLKHGRAAYFLIQLVSTTSEQVGNSIPVPPVALKMGPQGKLVWSGNRDLLDDAPRIGRQEVEDMNAGWLAGVYRFYGVEPWWDESAPEIPGTVSREGAGAKLTSPGIQNKPKP